MKSGLGGVRLAVSEMPMRLVCERCGLSYPPEKPWIRCSECGGRLKFVFKDETPCFKPVDGLNSMWRYRSVLPIPEEWPPVSLVEGLSPFVRAVNLGEKLGLGNLYLKDDSRNPTGSFRDRAASLMVTWAHRLGFKKVIAASNGNMGASLAAYTAKVGLACKIVVPKNVDEGKIIQLLIYGSEVDEHGLYLDDAIEKASEIDGETGVYQATPELNPLSLEAQKTIAYEVWEQLGRIPDVVVVPVGSGSCLYSVWKGFKELQETCLASDVPRMVAVQAEGCAPIVEAFKKGVEPTELISPKTKATAILVRKPVYGVEVLEALRDSEGTAVAIRDEEMFRAERELARLEGLFVEPSSSSTVAALPRLLETGFLEPGETVVCILTGSGLKAPSISDFLSYRRRAVELSPETGMKVRILRILAKGSRHGYGVWKALRGAISLQAVYQHLRDLEKRGYVESRRLDGRRMYELTEEGRQLLKVFRVLSRR